jgi:hypothetical protein
LRRITINPLDSVSRTLPKFKWVALLVILTIGAVSARIVKSWGLVSIFDF